MNIIGFTVLVLFIAVAAADLPTNYQHYTGDGISEGLNADQRHFTLNGKNISIYSGAFHYFRVHKSQWRDRLRKVRAAGLNTVETYVAWNLHEPQSGVYDFGNGGSDHEDFVDVRTFIQMAQEEDLFVLLRAGPYICAEFEFGGLPSWLLRESGIQVRTSDEVYLKYVRRYFEKLFAQVVDLQFTKGGPIIALQVENEYGNTGNSDPNYLHALKQIYQDNGIVELLYTSDPPSAGTVGALPNELLMTANFNNNPQWNLQKLDTLQTNKPTMTMEYWSGWFDHFGEDHHTVSNETFVQIYEDILSYPASVNIYMFVGSTNFGFNNGANSLYSGTNNSGLQPDVTSYDYDAPISENGDLTDKYYAVQNLMKIYSTVETQLPEVPEPQKRVAYPDLKIEQQLLLSEIIDTFEEKLDIENIVPMEYLDINNQSGQSHGYIVYRKTNLDLSAGATLTIKGYVRDTVLVLLNGQLVSPTLNSKEDLNNFGYWRMLDSSLVLTTSDVENVTLDLVVENIGRNNYGALSQFQQFKGLIDDVLIDDEVIKNWQVVPLEFKKAWNNALSGWHAVSVRENTPALYKASFNIDSDPQDTYINVQDWEKGIVIINGFVLGRVFMVGPQQALYLPAGLLRQGQNDVIIFEHFTAPDTIKFTTEPIWGVGTNLK